MCMVLICNQIIHHPFILGNRNKGEKPSNDVSIAGDSSFSCEGGVCVSVCTCVCVRVYVCMHVCTHKAFYESLENLIIILLSTYIKIYNGDPPTTTSFIKLIFDQTQRT